MPQNLTQTDGSPVGLTAALRALARDRAAVRVVTGGGDTSGRLDRVGADHVDLTVVPPEGARRPGSTATAWTIPFAAIDVVHSG